MTSLVMLPSAAMGRTPRIWSVRNLSPDGPSVNQNDGGVTFCRNSLSRRLDRVDVRVAEPEVVADLVDQDVGDHLVQGDVAALGPFVEDRAAVEEDAAGLRLG